MDIIISSNTNMPIYEQITSQIKAMIIVGDAATPETPSPSPCGRWQNRCT